MISYAGFYFLLTANLNRNSAFLPKTDLHQRYFQAMPFSDIKTQKLILLQTDFHFLFLPLQLKI